VGYPKENPQESKRSMATQSKKGRGGLTFFPLRTRLLPGEDTWLEALEASPLDAASWLVYADWLADEGEERRGHFIRTWLPPFLAQTKTDPLQPPYLLGLARPVDKVQVIHVRGTLSRVVICVTMVQPPWGFTTDEPMEIWARTRNGSSLSVLKAYARACDSTQVVLDRRAPGERAYEADRAALGRSPERWTQLSDEALRESHRGRWFQAMSEEDADFWVDLAARFQRECLERARLYRSLLGCDDEG
jgi:uncharacterized protein (TIGR02996 family)